MDHQPPRLGKMQLQIMQQLWSQSELTARQMTERLSRIAPTTHSTVQTLLRKMEAKELIAHEDREGTFVYRPLYQQSEVSGALANDFLDRVFQGSISKLVSHFLAEGRPSPEELSRLRALVDSLPKE
jgi:BlaI family penicillinase repressor